MNKRILPVIAIVAVVVVVIFGLYLFVVGLPGVENVPIGHRMVIKKTLFEGKGKLEIRTPGIQFYNPITKDHEHNYDIKTHTYEMTAAGTGSKKGKDERLEVKGRSGRKIWISAYFRHHINPDKVTEIHNTVGPNYENILIHPYIQKVAKNCTTRRYTAFEASAGETRQALQEEIINVLQYGEAETTTKIDKKGNTKVLYTGKSLEPQLKARGIIFEDFGILKVELDPEYQKLVDEKQAAHEREEIAIKETDELEQLALKAKAEAKAEKNKRIQKAEANKREIELAAEAEKSKRIAEAEGSKQAKILNAEGILAEGKAKAKAKELMLKAYQGEGGRRYAEVKKAEALGAGIQKIYYVPSNMQLNTIAKDFENAIAIGLPGN